jgi:AcrR family transcriptional regulator
VSDGSTPSERVLAAAFAEFATYGVAGARIDRIAETARTSKERVYTYFRSKEELYEGVAAAHMQAAIDSASLDVRDVPRYVGELFDYFVAHPAHLRLLSWARLERAGVTSPSTDDLIARKIKTIADAQTNGLITDEIPALDILMVIGQLATAWPSSTELHGQADSADPTVIAERRAAAVEIASRLFPPAH